MLEVVTTNAVFYPRIASAAFHRTRLLCWRTAGTSGVGCDVSIAARWALAYGLAYMTGTTKPRIPLPLREILRARRELPKEEVAVLLDGLPRVLDQLPGKTSPKSLLHEVLLIGGGDWNPWLAQPVSTWPPFGIELVQEEPQEPWEDGRTMLPVASSAGTHTQRMAALIYELLGGRLSHFQLLSGQYAPLSELDESGNQLLRAVLAGTLRWDVRTLWKEWLKASGAGTGRKQVAEKVWVVEQSLLVGAHTGEFVEFHAVDLAVPPTRVVSRSVFRIGRARSMTDLATRIEDRSGLQVDATLNLSRIHATMEWTANGVIVRDGDGTRASENGSQWNAARLMPDSAESVAGQGLLILAPGGCGYGVSVQPVPVAASASWPLAGQARNGVGERGNEEWGAIVFSTPPQWTPTRHAVWLLHGAPLSPTRGGTFLWRDHAHPAPIMVHRNKMFWLLQPDGGRHLQVGDVTVNPGHAAPLGDGQTVEMDGVRFRLVIR